MTLRGFLDRILGRTPPAAEPDTPPKATPRVVDLDPEPPVTWGGSHPVGFDPANPPPKDDA